MALSFEMLGLLFILAMLSGFIDAMAGGGGMITIPALLMTGMPPAMALGTNKLQACGGSFSASWYFLRHKAVDIKTMGLPILLTFIGAALGTILIQKIESRVVEEFLPFLILAIGLYFLFSPTLGEKDKHRRMGNILFAFSACFAIGFYDGLFGPGTGSFFCLAFVALLGFNLPKATAHAKVLNFTSNVTSLFFFLLGGKIIWGIGLLMMVGQLIGARMGASLVLTKGQRLIRPMVVLMSFLLTFKMAWEQGLLTF